MISSEKFIEYLENRIPDFSKISKKGQILFTCPNIANHKYKSKSPTATPISGSDKFYCLQCNWKGTIYDCIRLLELDKKEFTDTQLIEYITNTMKIDNYPELESYKKYGWYLFAIVKNGKKPLKDEHWREKEFCFNEKSKWLGWIESGYNLAVNCEFSDVMIVDFDDKEITPEFLSLRDEFRNLLEESKTLMQNTPHYGKHYVFKYDTELCFKQKVNLGGGLKIDTRTHKGYFLVSPSKINNVSYNWVNLDSNIKPIPEKLKNKLLEIIRKEKDKPEMSEETKQLIDHPIELKGDNLSGCRNNSLVQFGGVLLKMGLPIDKVRGILYYLNANWFSNRAPSSEIDAMIGSLEGYKQTEESTHEKAIYECCELLQIDISANEIEKHTNLKKNIVNKYLSQFHKEGKLVRKRHGRYDLKQKVEWTTEPTILGEEYKYNIPYFNDVAHFYNGDIILIGGKTGEGKTHIAMNIIKQMKNQGIIPYYIGLESGSRHEKIAQQLGLTQKDYYISKDPIENPTQIEIESNAFTVLDWLYTGEDFAMTQSIFKYLSDEMRRKGGILVVFTQLKEDYNWFAVNLIKSFARFAARFIYDDTTGVISHFEIDKMTDPKGHNLKGRVDTEFNFDTKLLIKKEIR